MQALSAYLKAYGCWWCIGLLMLLLLLDSARIIHGWTQPLGAQRSAEPTATPAAVAPVKPPLLTWDQGGAVPERFVIRRSIDGGTWQDVGVLPGATGTGLTWQDTTLPASSEPRTLKYAVYAVAPSGTWSEASNIAVTVVGEAEAESVSLGECVAVKRGKKKTIITCVQSEDK